MRSVKSQRKMKKILEKSGNFVRGKKVGALVPVTYEVIGGITLFLVVLELYQELIQIHDAQFRHGAQFPEVTNATQPLFKHVHFTFSRIFISINLSGIYRYAEIYPKSP